MKTTIYVARHGESNANKTGILTGITEVDLSELGLKQAQKICEFLADKDIDAIYSSPISRAVATVTPLAKMLGKEVVTDARFREVNVGVWEGKRKEFLLENEPEFPLWCKNPVRICAPNGEKPEDAGARFVDGLREVAQKHCGKNIVVAAHGAVILSAMCTIGKFDFYSAQMKDIARNASVSKLVYEDGKFSVEFYAYEEYLAELKAEFKY